MFRIAAAVAAACVTASASAQCRVSSGTNEGQLLTYHTAQLAFSTADGGALSSAGVRVGLEGSYLPAPNAALQQTQLCFVRKTENTALTTVFARPRLTVSLPAGLAVEGSYVPPVRVGDAKPDLGAVALSETVRFEAPGNLGAADLTVRGETGFGKVTGPVTCPRSALQTTSPSAPCYGTQPSNDTFHPDMAALDVVAGLAPPGSALTYYVGVGANRMDPLFQVGFTDATGHTDSTRVQLDKPLVTSALMAGLTATVWSRFDAGLQVYSVPGHATTIRVEGGARWP